jgi:hypothetical protein
MAALVKCGNRVPDAVQRSSRYAAEPGPTRTLDSCDGPRLCSAALRTALRPGHETYPRPTNGILLAMTVMNSTLASSGRLAM